MRRYAEPEDATASGATHVRQPDMGGDVRLHLSHTWRCTHGDDLQETLENCSFV